MTGISKAVKLPVTGKIDISEAVVIQDEKKNETVNGNNDLDEYTKNLKDQKTINVDDIGKKEQGESITIDFMNEGHIENVTTAKTKRSEAPVDEEKSQFEGKNPEELKKEIKSAEEDSVKNFKTKDFEDIAKFIIFLIDTSFSTFFKWWAKDSSDQAYSLSKEKQNMLVYQLTLILVKYQARFSIEFMFLCSLVLLYAPAFMKAKDRKKEINEIKTKDIKATNEKIEKEIKLAVLRTEKPEENNIIKDNVAKVISSVSKKETPIRKPGRTAKI